MKKKSMALFVITILLCIPLLCACDSKASVEAEIAEYNEKITSLNSDLEYYQNIYDEALSTYQNYSKYSGKSEWDSELSRTKSIMDKAQTKIASIKRDIDLYENFLEIKQKELEKYD